MTSLVTGVAALRLTADAVLDLWQRDEHQAEGDRTAARAELVQSSVRVNGWYDELASSLGDRHEVPVPLARDADADDRFVDAVRHDLLSRDGNATATAVRMIWTSDHLDAAPPPAGKPGRARARGHRSQGARPAGRNPPLAPGPCLNTPVPDTPADKHAARWTRPAEISVPACGKRRARVLQRPLARAGHRPTRGGILTPLRHGSHPGDAEWPAS